MKKFIITEEELNQIVTFVASRPLGESLQVYQTCVSVAQNPLVEDETEDESSVKELKASK
jgi:hypothetical protein